MPAAGEVIHMTGDPTKKSCTEDASPYSLICISDSECIAEVSCPVLPPEEAERRRAALADAAARVLRAADVT